MKTNMYVELLGFQTNTKDLLEKAKNIWKEQGGKVKDIQTLDVYFKPEENMCYYVINETEKGFFEA